MRSFFRNEFYRGLFWAVYFDAVEEVETNGIMLEGYSTAFGNAIKPSLIEPENMSPFMKKVIPDGVLRSWGVPVEAD